MDNNLKPYPAYKDSGVPWLGAVPEHWKIQPGFSAIREKQHKNTGMAETTVLSLSYGRIVIKPPNKLHGLVPASFETYQVVDPSDIIIRPTDLQNDWTSLRVGIARDRGIITSAYLCLRTIGPVIPEYAYWLLHAFDLMKVFYGMGSGLRQNLDFTDLKRMPVIIPSLEEQHRIAAFLDHIDRRVNRLIRAKRRMIALLNEQKQAIIHRAVTRGLDPDVRLKPSGVEWLGEVPEHWVVTQIRSIARVVRGGSPRPAGSPLYFHGNGEPWITVGELTKDESMYLYKTSTQLTELGTQHSRSIEVGTLLLTNSGATLGVPKISQIKGCINDGVAAFLNVRSNISKEYLYFYWYTQTIHLKAWVDLGAQPNLNTQIIGGWPVLIPPRLEQDQIVERVVRETATLKNTINHIQREIELVREYRTRLIADVVTGKLDVRGVDLGAYDDELAELDAELADEGDEELELVDEAEE